MDDLPSEKSEFSMDFSLFYRINGLLYRLNDASFLMNMYVWYDLILVLWKEVAPLVKPEDRKPYLDRMDEFIPTFIDIKNQIDATGGYVLTLDLYKKLQAFEISLRDIINSKGIYLRVKEDGSYGFRGGS